MIEMCHTRCLWLHIMLAMSYDTLYANFMILLLSIDLIFVPKDRPSKFICFHIFWGPLVYRTKCCSSSFTAFSLILKLA